MEARGPQERMLADTMHWQKFGWNVLGLIALLAVTAGAWVYSLPPAAKPSPPTPVAQAETDETLAALKPRKGGQRPVVAIIGVNDATETTDYLMPYGIMKRADIADVVAVGTHAGPIKLYPALQVEPEATTIQFDEQHPQGADYVIVPAMSRDNDPAALEWIKAQAKKGAVIIGICAGAKVVAAADLLDGKRATTHWYYLDELREQHPTLRYVADRRLVVDSGVATTTGISASMPMMLTLIEAIAGRGKAEAVARDLGVATWDAQHQSAAFTFNRPFALTAVTNKAQFWNQEKLGIRLSPGVDEVSLALVADAWSRTYRSRAISFSTDAVPVQTRNGLRIVPDEATAEWPAEQTLAKIDQPPAVALDTALQEIGARYGNRTASFVAMQLEYPRPAAAD